MSSHELQLLRVEADEAAASAARLDAEPAQEAQLERCERHAN